MATENVRRYFARAWENGSGPDTSGPWKHDYIRNTIALLVGYFFLRVTTGICFAIFDRILLKHFPATAARWCFVQDGDTTTRLQKRRQREIEAGVGGAFITRFIFERFLILPWGGQRRHWWYWEINSCFAMVLQMALVLVVMLLIIAVCWIGDRMKQSTGWRSNDQCHLKGHCSIGHCTCSQHIYSEWKLEKTSDSQSQSVHSSEAEDAPDGEHTHGLPPWGPGAQRAYGPRDHYSKHPHNPALLGSVCHTPYHQRAGYTEHIRNLIRSPVVEVRKLLSPMPKHISIIHGPNGTCAYHTITVRPEFQHESLEELRLKHYQEQQEEVKAQADVEKPQDAEVNDQGTGTPWLRVRQFANSIFSNSTATTASRDSFGTSTLGRRGLLVDLEDGDISEGNTTPLLIKDAPCKTYT